jgi:hypothetical protein
MLPVENVLLFMTHHNKPVQEADLAAGLVL